MYKTLMVGVVIVVAAGGYYWWAQQANGTDSAVETGSRAAVHDTDAKAGPFSGSLLDLVKRGGDWKCTVDSKANTGVGTAVSSGIVYVSGNNVRGDFTTAVPQLGTVQAHMIADGSDVYTWTSVLPQGFKAKITASGNASGATSGQGFDANQSYSYDCQPASPDASLFVVPANVSFRSI